MDIVGAGMAGLLAGNMLKHRDPVLHEIQPSLPNNHSAVLRFRSSQVGDVLGIPFRKVKLIKTYVPWHNPIADALAYSYKNSHEYHSDRSIINGLVIEERFIAPSNLIQRMQARLSNVLFGKAYSTWSRADWQPIISTLPMPALMKLLDYPRRNEVKFNAVPGINVKAKVANCDAYVSLLVPDPSMPFSRISITGNEMIIELPYVTDAVGDAEGVPVRAANLLGLHADQLSDIRAFKQNYAKITPIDENARKDFIFWATANYAIFSLGRFATWRPGLLLDDLVEDIRLIDRWLEKKDRYAIARHRA